MRSLLVWALFCAIAALTFVAYAATSAAAANGRILMPLDDAYIHFQYARQIAAGELYVYNPGLPPTSGATSFLYPFILALGYQLSFQGLQLGSWAMIVGAVAQALSGWLIASIGRACGAWSIGVVVAVVFMIYGATAWHFMSGMETGLVMMSALLALYGIIARRDAVAVGGAALSALLRPEGAILAVLISVFFGIKIFNAQAQSERKDAGRILWILIPMLAIGVQPLVNLLVTGSVVATGNSAKSLFGVVPFDLGYVITRIWDNFTRMWREFFVLQADTPAYLMVIPAGLALIGCFFLIKDRTRRGVGVLIVMWFVGISAAISTLDTAFWHFKRYHMPLIAALFALAVVGLLIFHKQNAQHEGTKTQRREGIQRMVLAIAAFALIIAAASSSADFLQSYGVNVGYVYAQPYQMVLWLRENAPDDARVAVHDVGMMRYIGEVTTLDMVGLTTAGAADYWRNGPGSVGEWIMQQRPDLIASYGDGHGLGLGYLQATDLYANPQAQYTVTLDDARNVALAAETQGIYVPDYAAAERAVYLATLPTLYPEIFGRRLEVIDAVNVANLESERNHDYRWTADQPLGGFPTELAQFWTTGCSQDCMFMDGGRRIVGQETFTFTMPFRGDALLVTRVHALEATVIEIQLNGNSVGQRVLPALPGVWLEIATPLYDLDLGEHSITVAPIGSGVYMPYRHWIYAGSVQREVSPPTAALTTFQDGNIVLLESSTVRMDGERLTGTLDWFTPRGAQGDTQSFIHVYAADDLTTILRQNDQRPGRGALPPGNWLPGGFQDTFEFSTAELPTGTYRVAIGFFDPVTFERLTPTGGDERARFWLGDVNIP